LAPTARDGQAGRRVQPARAGVGDPLCWIDDWTERRRIRRIAEAKFPRLKRLSEFNVDAVPTIQPATLAALATGAYMDAGEPVVLLGDSGTGKSHLLIALGLAACEQGRRDQPRMKRTPREVDGALGHRSSGS
jgi:IstB-like ATP binding protein